MIVLIITNSAGCLQENADFYSSDIAGSATYAADVEACIEHCYGTTNCKAFTFLVVTSMCHPKFITFDKEDSNIRPFTNAISGNVQECLGTHYYFFLATIYYRRYNQAG